MSVFTGATQRDSQAVQSTASRLRLHGDTLYEVSDQAGSGGALYVIDATDPVDIVLLGQLGPYNSLLKHARCPSERLGDIVCVVAHNDGNGRLACVNVADPAAPAIVGSVLGNSPFFGVQDCFRSGNTVFSVGNNLTATNVADPAAPSVISVLSINFGRSIVPIGGGYAAISSDSGPYSVKIINISNPGAMSIVATLVLPSSFQMSSGLAKHPTAAIVYCAVTPIGGTGGGLLAIDVSTVTAPAVVYSETLATANDCVVTSDGLGLVLGGLNTLRFYDLATPSSPSLSGKWHRDDDPVGVNQNILDPGAARMMALKASNDRHLYVKGDATKVVAFDLVPKPKAGWVVGAVAIG